jgi:hypothetical protein
MVTLEAFSELLHVLYSSPLQQEQWQRFFACPACPGMPRSVPGMVLHA